MNDVKITDRSDGSIELAVPHRPTLTLWAPEVAALREHFAAEQHSGLVDMLTRERDELARLLAAAEQPATPTPSTEQIKAEAKWDGPICVMCNGSGVATFHPAAPQPSYRYRCPACNGHGREPS